MIHLSYEELVDNLKKNVDPATLSSQLQALNSNFVHAVPDPTPHDFSTSAAMRLASSSVPFAESVQSPLPAGMVAKGVGSVYDSGITALEMAKLLKELDYSMSDIALGIHDNYTDESCGDIAAILLDSSMFPAATKSQMTAALLHAGFTQGQVDPVIAKYYPSQAFDAKADFSNPEIKTSNMTITTGQGMVYNQYYKHSWKMLYPGRSYLEAKFNVADATSSMDLILVNLTSSMGNQPGYSPVDIVINGKLFKDNYNPGSMDYKKDTFSIGSFLQDGDNSIRIEFQSQPWAKTHYWIQSLEVKG